MTETLVQWFVTHLGGKAAKELIIFIISMILSYFSSSNVSFLIIKSYLSFCIGIKSTAPT